ncbi:sugar ABC transporter permease [Clostridium botulinum]|uniref:ABC-type sugar transport system, permease component n=1 Tax=Clostridium botulinum (strain Eklund 17B / Type B) TaxID=935198 RepID=B2THZ6_CLOBB|nr:MULTISPECIES: sugar ABC transporter permease [Clostridium]ACD23336.1 ABC-type sugar transport system, permease component [Clostridium botulinum B str. Eklund 17B (NRP)]AIY80676.1 binding--dependent transport system inner membrane component family protein [Clostridium botulinum 202F]KAI3345342.1 sugar ABC transporter permease [Clostridium botulinum]SJT61963.1 sn-glycerol-3-phosphate transport system permease protein ugpA [Clostridioides difficile]KFX57842.1 sugar ABC transporter permease [Cl
MKEKRRVFLLMSIPAVILFFIFHTLPLLKGISYSFTNWRGFGTFKFVGIKNYISIFSDERIINSYMFTFKFALLSTIIVNVISLILAVGLNSKIKFKSTLRGIYFIPNILGGLIVGYIFNYIFTFILTGAGQAIGSEILSKSILGNPNLAWLGVVIVASWQAIAFNTIIYISGLQTISEDVYEASAIDGANKWIQFKKITFPLLAPFFTINMVLAMKNFLNVFDQIISLTGGGPSGSTESIAVLIYKAGFDGSQFGYQSANSVIYFIVVVVISLLQLRILERREMQL